GIAVPFFAAGLAAVDGLIKIIERLRHEQFLVVLAALPPVLGERLINEDGKPVFVLGGMWV
ncbi:MAG: hypothetical protein RQ723_10125, partial [Desulfuromonadales bacterium]|nr:hypothetical protein [Desulfuromonadales bacterium]